MIYLDIMSLNYHFLFQLDRNECLIGVHDCEQKCTNTEGGYKCECHEGYYYSYHTGFCQGKFEFQEHLMNTHTYHHIKISLDIIYIFYITE